LDDPPILGYQTRTASRVGMRWLAPVLTGIAAGVILGVSRIFAICFVGVPVTFMVGALAAFCVNSGRTHKMLLGSLGVLACTVTVFLAVMIANWDAGFAGTPADWLQRFAWVGALVGLPGIAGVGMMTAISDSGGQRTARR
jgi:hypothetical protein